MKPNRIFGLLVPVLLISLAALAGDDFENSVTKGNQYVKKKDYDRAIDEYKKALVLQPKNGKINLLAGLASAAAGRLDEGERYTQSSLAIEPSFAGYNNLGLIYSNKGEYQRAIDGYKKALELSPESYKTWYQLGLVYATELKFEDAIVCYEKVLQLNPAFTDAHLGLGSAYFWNGDTSKALGEAEKLKTAGDTVKAQALEDWVKNTETKKNKPAQSPPAPSSSSVAKDLALDSSASP